MALDFDIVFNNILTLGILFGVGYIIYKRAQGTDALEKFKGKFSQVLKKTKLR